MTEIASLRGTSVALTTVMVNHYGILSIDSTRQLYSSKKFTATALKHMTTPSEVCSQMDINQYGASHTVEIANVALSSPDSTAGVKSQGPGSSPSYVLTSPIN